jgi:hypothetical protein
MPCQVQCVCTRVQELLWQLCAARAPLELARLSAHVVVEKLQPKRSACVSACLSFYVSVPLKLRAVV